MIKRSGSENRRRTHIFTVRFSPKEVATVRLKADRAGLSIAALLRQALLNVEPPRAARTPTIKQKAVLKLLAEIGKIGSNVNQLTKHANAGRYQQASIELAMHDIMDIRMACLQALGREPVYEEDS